MTKFLFALSIFALVAFAYSLKYELKVVMGPQHFDPVNGSLHVMLKNKKVVSTYKFNS